MSKDFKKRIEILDKLYKKGFISESAWEYLGILLVMEYLNL